MGDDYEPRFCWNCGAHQNEVPVPDKSKRYNCGWCRGSHDHIDDIKICMEATALGTTFENAKAHRLIKRQVAHDARRDDVIRMARELSED